jgi:tetratricopeptide (TPR) repeat protein
MNATTKLLSLSILLALMLMLDLGAGSQALADEQSRERERKRMQERELQAQAYFEQARESMNHRRYEDAADLFERAYELGLAHELAGNALYWEAFARFRLDRTVELKRAAQLLRQLQAEYEEAATAEEAESLAARIYAELAERGEAEAAREITERASEEDIRQETRAAALQALMNMDPRKALPILEKVVQDDSPENQDLRRNALFIMCHEGGRQAEDLLIGMLETETDPEFLSDLVHCLAMSDSKRALDAMVAVYQRNKDPEVTQSLLMAIGHHHDSARAFDFLAQVALDEAQDVSVRAHALMALSQTDREARATKVVLQILETAEDRELLEMAIMSLSHMDDPAAQEALAGLLKNASNSQDEELMAMALHFSVSNGRVNLDTIRDLYQQARGLELKRQICHVLTMMDDEDAALDLLIEIARNETDAEIRRDAVFWVGQFENDRAAEFLLEVITED